MKQIKMDDLSTKSAMIFHSRPLASHMNPTGSLIASVLPAWSCYLKICAQTKRLGVWSLLPLNINPVVHCVSPKSPLFPKILSQDPNSSFQHIWHPREQIRLQAYFKMIKDGRFCFFHVTTVTFLSMAILITFIHILFSF